MMNQVFWQKIEAFVRNECAVLRKKQLKPDTCIVNNLMIDGEDGADLIEKYATVFGVNIDSFNYHDYFCEDYFDLLGLFSLALYIKRKINKAPAIPKHKKRLTLEMLYNSALEGRWLY